MKRSSVGLYAAAGLAAAALVGAVLVLRLRSSRFARRDPSGEYFPDVEGRSLAGAHHVIPSDFAGEPVILLVGFRKEAQFDIDRWLIGLRNAEVDARTFEVPVACGVYPRLLPDRVEEGMRKVFPRREWSSVVTVYADGPRIGRFTGTKNGVTARVVLLDQDGRVAFFHDDGFSAGALRDLVRALVGMPIGAAKSQPPA